MPGSPCVNKVTPVPRFAQAICAPVRGTCVVTDYLSSLLTEFLGPTTAQLTAQVLMALVAAGLLVGFVAAVRHLLHLARTQGGRPHSGPARAHARRRQVRLAADHRRRHQAARQGRPHPRRRRSVCSSASGPTSPSAAPSWPSSPCRSATSVGGHGPRTSASSSCWPSCRPRCSASSWPATAPAASGRCSAACARRPRWSATKCPWPCACWCRSSWPGAWT